MSELHNQSSVTYYFTAERNKPQELEATLNSIQNSPRSPPLTFSIHQLLPYFSQFAADHVARSLGNLPLLTNLMKFVKALLKSPYLSVELYVQTPAADTQLHQLIPSVLTCLLGKRLCAKPTEDHWELRDFSAQLLKIICSK
jgi:hypothetical protein